MLKRIIFVFLNLVFVLSVFSGCGYTSHKEYYSIEDYENIWDLAGFRHNYNDAQRFFPEKPNSENVLEFLCRYDEQLPLGEGIQLYLAVEFDNSNEFNSETERLKSMSYDASDLFETEQKVYATRICVDDSYEYAIINSDENVVTYIYIQSLPKDEIEFEHENLPKEYFRYTMDASKG